MTNTDFKILLVGRKEEWRTVRGVLIEAGNKSHSNDIREVLYTWADRAEARRDECEAILKVSTAEDSHK